MALPEDEAKQTPESGEESFESEALKQEALKQEALKQEVLDPIEADNEDGPPGQQGSDDEL